MAMNTVSVQPSNTIPTNSFWVCTIELLKSVLFFHVSASDDLVIEAEQQGEQPYNVVSDSDL